MLNFMELDRIDFELLRLLRKNARLANKDLAEIAGVAPSTALERVRRLREANVLQGFHAEVAPEAIGIGLQALVAVRMTRHSRPLLEHVGHGRMTRQAFGDAPGIGLCAFHPQRKCRQPAMQQIRTERMQQGAGDRAHLA